MANLKNATYCPAFDFEFSLIDVGLQSLLRKHGLNQPRLLAAMVPTQLAGEALSQRLRVLLDGLGPAGHTEGWHPQLLLLLLGARGEAAQLAERAGRLTGAQLSADAAQREREKRSQQQEAVQRRLQATHLAHLPTVWQGKRYRREAVLINEDERALLATGGHCFPTCPEHFLGYLEARGATTRTTGHPFFGGGRGDPTRQAAEQPPGAEQRLQGGQGRP